jgi:hypothetical protein
MPSLPLVASSTPGICGTCGDPTTLIGASAWQVYETLAPECTGAWIVYWWQRFPNVDSPAKAIGGGPTKSWWPFYLYW